MNKDREAVKTGVLLTAFLAIAMLWPVFALDAQDEAPRIRSYEENLKRWQDLSEEDRQAYRDKAKSLGPVKVSEMREELVKFSSMPKEERGAVIDNYKKFKSFTPKEKEDARQRYESFERMPQERKDEVRRQRRERKEPPSAGSGKEVKTRDGRPDGRTERIKEGPAYRTGKPQDAERPGRRRDDTDARREERSRPAGRGDGIERGGGAVRAPEMGREGRGPGPGPVGGRGDGNSGARGGGAPGGGGRGGGGHGGGPGPGGGRGGPGGGGGPRR